MKKSPLETEYKMLANNMTELRKQFITLKEESLRSGNPFAEELEELTFLLDLTKASLVLTYEELLSEYKMTKTTPNVDILFVPQTKVAGIHA